MYQSGFLGINQSLRLVAHTYASGAYKKECLLPPCTMWVNWSGWFGSQVWSWAEVALLFGGAGDTGPSCSHRDADTHVNTLSLLTSRLQISYWPAHNSFPGWTHSQEGKAFSLPTLVPQEAYRCRTLLQVADVTIVQFTTTSILFYQLFMDGH